MDDPVTPIQLVDVVIRGLRVRVRVGGSGSGSESGGGMMMGMGMTIVVFYMVASVAAGRRRRDGSREIAPSCSVRGRRITTWVPDTIPSSTSATTATRGIPRIP